MFHRDPQYGIYTILRQFYNKNEVDNLVCQDLLKYISLDKFGNDNKNFAAILINGHHDHRICQQLQKNIISELQSNNFSKSMIPKDIAKYLESILSKFEKSYLDRMSRLFKTREKLIRRMSSSNNQDDKKLQELNDMDTQLSGGATIDIVAVVQGNLYITHIGDNQIILVSKDVDSSGDCDKKFVLLAEEQSFHNEKEIHRIKESCGLDPDALRWLSNLSTERCHSRCIGDFDMKCKYAKYQDLREATSSPLISTPQESKFFQLEENFTHILLISSGLYYLVREMIYDKDMVPGEITRKFFDMKCNRPELSLDSLCKEVLESFVADHRGFYDQCQNLTCGVNTLPEYSHHDDLSILVIELRVSLDLSPRILDVADGFSLVNSVTTCISSIQESVNSKDSSNKMKDQFSSLMALSSSPTTLSAYVDFNDWTNALDKLSVDELAFIDSIIDAPESHEETIIEESLSRNVSRSSIVEENNNSAPHSPGELMPFCTKF